MEVGNMEAGGDLHT